MTGPDGNDMRDQVPMDQHAACTTCLRVRLFVMVAALLIVFLGWRPAAAVAVASAMPAADVIGAAIVALAAAAFVFRYMMWRGFRTR
ncbi:hypothetical protein ACVDG3_14980 [Meridianimarinicoccus sp. RP-17]|uniref:hypothetical protein n=1 Tax=Meridianimarinicoccus zhengii TaxID=2056810 RepID=UPI000DACA950|nr:hypothetical protein [Phycocomes zhengii]